MSLEQPSIVWHNKFPFGERVCRSVAEKQAVGEYVIQKYIQPHATVFLSDGSSTFHMSLRLFHSPRPLTLLTTNVAIAVERAVREEKESVRQMEVDLAGGIVDSELLMVRGDMTEDTIQTWISRSDVLVVSMRSFSCRTGPTERHPPSQRQISLACRTALKMSKKIVILADHAKMSREMDESHDTSVFSSAEEWEAATKSGHLWLITNRPPNPILGGNSAWICDKVVKDKELKRFIAHSRYLHTMLSRRYVEFPFNLVEQLSNQ